MFSAGVVAETQSASAKVVVEVKVAKVNQNQFGATMRQMEQGGGGSAFTRAGEIQEYTEARADANAGTTGTSDNSDQQPLDINIGGDTVRLIKAMNMNDIVSTGCFFELAHPVTNSPTFTKTMIKGFATELGFLDVNDGCTFQAFYNQLICEPNTVDGVSQERSNTGQWHWDTKTSTDSSASLKDTIIKLTDGHIHTVEIIL